MFTDYSLNLQCKTSYYLTPGNTASYTYTSSAAPTSTAASSSGCEGDKCHQSSSSGGCSGSDCMPAESSHEDKSKMSSSSGGSNY